MIVRPAGASDRTALLRMRTALWPDAPEREVDDVLAVPPTRGLVLLAIEDERPCGFAEFALRKFADGCESSPVAYLEGIWVDEARRRREVGRRLVREGEAWARSLGVHELASDCAIDNRASEAFHLAIGFEEVQRTINFKRDLER